MSVSYKAVGWNAFKKRYDFLLALGVVLGIATFMSVGLVAFPNASPEIQLMRATAVTAIALLHFILMIGPMARLDSRWLPLLYNRRHLGVTMFLVALIHSLLATVIYHSGSDVNPIVSIFVTDAGSRLGAFPFQAFGFLALIILFVMAATSHDFWLANLTAPIWKTLHMGVYVAYALLIIHVCFGALQAELHPFYLLLTGVGMGLISLLHLVAGFRQIGLDQEPARAPAEDGYVPVCELSELEENRPLGVTLSGERVAVLRYEGNLISAVSGVCQHQNGPLAEGKYVFGCLTCPWHGYQYKPADGCSPPPFTEKIPTFRVRVEGGKVWVHPQPNPAGTPVEPARC